ncbi:AAA family ATPase [Ochrobactrum quorumnocens]|uniref:AAA family ATPase n=1 Tax=Ochrobactrum quorumnocens TaxID=271865 RepID=UPI001F207944|nr:AAA family ATPase [[Ochrobactrum] quorumnocens]
MGPNGGGKTNLLECVSNILQNKIIPPVHGYINQKDSRFTTINTVPHQSQLAKNFNGSNLDQIIELVVEATSIDIDNICSMSQHLPEWIRKYSVQTNEIFIGQSWEKPNISIGETISFSIRNSQQIETSSPDFRKYLHYFQLDRMIRHHEGKAPLTFPILSLPVSRSSGVLDPVVHLSQVNIPSMRQNFQGGGPAMPGQSPGVVPLTLAQLSERMRALELKHGQNAFKELASEENLAGFSAALGSIGYEWRLDCIDPNTNSYTLILKKQGIEFQLAHASSGERELLTFLLSIYVLNIRDALVVVDEPELHLHPRWQKSLYKLFERLAADTGNQFLLATHSPTFISPTSIRYVSRVYSEHQKSRIIDINGSDLPSTKHQFEVINSQNNERMFFADLVVLVEGPSDRMFFERLLDVRTSSESSVGATLEFISVGGKTMFDTYASILDAWEVKHVRIADLDYIQEIGTGDLKLLFEPDAKKINKAVADASTRDGQTIIDMIDTSIATNTWAGDTNEWHRIKAKRSKLNAALTDGQKEYLHDFINTKAMEGVFVLSSGALEAYLPDGHTSKDIDKLISLINSNDFLDRLPAPQKEEIIGIVDAIEKMRVQISQAV